MLFLPCLVPPKPPSCVLLPAAPGFTRPPLCAGEAALRRGLEHADGDHSSLIQVYEAFVQSKWLSLHLRDSQEKPTQQTDLSVQEEEVLCPQVILHASWDLITDVSFLLQDGADETWCQARGLSWEALCQARKLRAELLELMQRIELPLSLPAFGSEQNRRDLQKALLSGYFLKVGEE